MEILNYMNKNHVLNPGTEKFLITRSKLFKKGIKLSWSKDNRVIFSALKNKPYFDEKLYREANGTVLYYNIYSQDWKPLVISTPKLRTNINLENANKYLFNNKYEIYHAFDGTMINLYYWDNNWRISSSNGFDITDIEWCDITFKKALDEVLNYLKIDLYNNLETHKCYTFMFKHPVYHPFWGQSEPNYQLMFNRDVDLKTFEINYEPILNIDKQKEIEFKINSFKDLFSKLPKTLDNYLENKFINYGYIIYSNDEKTTGDHSYIYLESKLSACIRRLWYHQSLIKKSENYDRINYILIHSYLNSPIFIKLFPQYQEYFDKFENIANQLSDNIYKYFTEEKHKDIENMDKIEKCGYTLYLSIKNILSLKNMNERESKTIINSYILNNSSLNYFYKLAFDEN